MITWHLWGVLRYPLRQNEVFKWVWREYSIEHIAIQPQWNMPIRMLMMFIGISLVMVLIPVVLVVTLLSLLTFPFLILIFNGTVLGAYWVFIVVNVLAHHQRDERSQLLNTTPRGTLGLSWIMATVSIHRGDVLRTAYRLVRSVTVILLTLLGVGLVFIAAHLPSSPLRSSQVTLLIDLIGLIAFVIAAWLDHIHSIVLAAIISILAPTYRSERLLTRIAAVSIYITLQMLFYAIVIAFLRTTQFTAAIMIDSVIVQRIIVMIFTLIVFYGLRETLIISLYRLMLWRYEVTANEFQEIVV